jgi:hypothetical protein
MARLTRMMYRTQSPARRSADTVISWPIQDAQQMWQCTTPSYKKVVHENMNPIHNVTFSQLLRPLLSPNFRSDLLVSVLTLMNALSYVLLCNHECEWLPTGIDPTRRCRPTLCRTCVTVLSPGQKVSIGVVVGPIFLNWTSNSARLRTWRLLFGILGAARTRLLFVNLSVTLSLVPCLHKMVFRT